MSTATKWLMLSFILNIFKTIPTSFPPKVEEIPLGIDSSIASTSLAVPAYEWSDTQLNQYFEITYESL